MMNRLLLLLLVLLPAVYAPAQTKPVQAWYCQACGNDCDNISYAAAGKCPHCGMALVLQNTKDHVTNTTQKKLKVLFYLQDGVEVLDFAGPMEVFTDAGFDVAVVSKTKDPIIAQGVLTIIPKYSITDAPPADIIAFFGGNAGNASDDPAVIDWLKKAPVRGYYFSVCTGAFILGKAGLLDNLTVTTFHESIDNLQKAVPKARVLAHTRFIDNGRVITTAGISAGIDGALHLVAKINGQPAAAQVARFMEYDKWIPEEGKIMDKTTVLP